MDYTKEQVLEMLEVAFEECENQSDNSNTVIVSAKNLFAKTGFTDEEEAKIYKMFGVKHLTELLNCHPKFEASTKHVKDKKLTVVQLKQNIKIETNTNTKENKMETKLMHDRIEKLLEALNNGLYGKEEAIRLALLTAIAGESIFFLGAPGSAKSMIARRMLEAFKKDDNKGMKYFETLMHQFSAPEDIFGPLSVKALTGEIESGEEEYKRLIKNYLPKADIAFLDEIWKASPAIQNTLLTIINEKNRRSSSKDFVCRIKRNTTKRAWA